MLQSKRLILCSLLWLIPIAHAEIYKRVDAEGRITYSNVQTKDSVRLKIGNPAPKKSVNPVDAQKKQQMKMKAARLNQQYRAQISRKTQSKRDATRREILLDELATEKTALLAAKEAYKAGKANPEIYRRRNADGSVSTLRNVPKYQSKMQKLTAQLEAHQRNIQLLQKEISALN